MEVNKVELTDGTTLIDLSGDTLSSADQIAKGIVGHLKDGTTAIGTMESGGGGLPSGFTAIATGTHTLSADVAGGSTFTVTHNLGAVPDLFMFFATANVATTYSMLLAMRSSMFGYRSSTYLNKCFYHGNSTTTAAGSDVTTSYGIKTLTATAATVTTYSNSTSYYWRKGTYKWIAIKF